MLVSYNWLQEYFEDTLPQPDELAGILNTRSFEVEGVEAVDGDTTVDIDVLPNRAHDCLSHYGIAKEISVVTGMPIKKIEYVDGGGSDVPTCAPTISHDDCIRSVVCEVSNVVIGESPDELKRKLEVLGQRSINTIVDITNIVMYEMGQPLHAFDRDKISGDTFDVRGAREGEKVSLLGGTDVELSEGMLVIADKEAALDVAGVKGGLKAELDEETTTILLSAANFNSTSIRKTSSTIGVRTDASKRFEQGITPEYAYEGMCRALELIKKYASNEATTFSTIADTYPRPTPPPAPITVSADYVNKKLGTSLTGDEIENVLEKLTCTYTRDVDDFTITPPYDRLDLTIPEDIAEEIGRIFGYENITETPITSIDRQPDINPVIAYTRALRLHLIEQDFSEIMTPSFRTEGDIKVKKSFADDRQFLRNSLVKGMEDALAMNGYNADLLGLQHVKLFEFGKVFTAEGEKFMLSLGVVNNKIKKPKPHELLAEVIAGLPAEFGITSATVSIPDGATSVEIHLDPLIANYTVPEAYVSYPTISDNTRYKPFSMYPFVLRDIAVWIEDGKGDEASVTETIKQHAGDLLVRLDLFDVYHKQDEGKTSYAFRLVFQSMEKTLSDEEINPIMDSVTQTLNAQDGHEVR